MGPWADFKGSDLVHLALGGVMMNCGYDPAPGGTYDLPPIAPADVARLPHRRRAARVADHRRAALSLADGEGPAAVVRDPRGGGEIHRGRPHVVGDAARARAAPDLPSRARNRLAASVHRAHQGRALGDGESGHAPRRDGSGSSRCSSATAWRPASTRRRPRCRQGGRFVPGTGPEHGPSAITRMEAVQRFVRAFTYDNVPWREAQEAGMLWAPLRKPHENALDPHWLARRSCTDVEHPELGRSFRYATSKWLATGTSWSVGRRAPLLNEDAKTVVLPARSRPAGDRRLGAAAGATRRSRRAASRSRCTASASWTSRGSWPRPAARGS